MKKDDFERIAATLGGLCLLGCLRGSPAERAGLRYGDVVVEVNGQPTPNWVSYIDAIRVRRPVMTVRFFRDGTERTAELALPPEPPPQHQQSTQELLRELARNFIVPTELDDDDSPLN